MYLAILAILAGLILLSEDVRVTLLRFLLPFATVVGLLALISGLFALSNPLGVALLLAGLILAMNTLYAIPGAGQRLRSTGLWLSRFRLPLGLANVALGLVAIV
jgi:hypothetical protein